MLEFLSLKQSAFGLDISDLSLKIAKLEKVGDRVELVSFGEEKVPEGLVSAGEIIKEDELASTIAHFLPKVHGRPLNTTYAVVSLPEEKAFLQVVQLPLLYGKELEQAIRFEAENYIPFPMDSVYLDYQVVPPLSNHIDHTDVLLVAIPKPTVDSYVSVLLKAGLKPVALELESLSISRALFLQKTSPSTTLILDFGATRTGFVVFSGKSPRFTVSIPVSSSQLTDALMAVLRIDRNEAEKLKDQYGVAPLKEKGANAVREALNPVLKELAGKVKQYMDYYGSHASHEHLQKENQRITHISLCGGGALLKGFPEFLSQELKVEVSVGNPWVNILSEKITHIPPLSFEDSLAYATVLGLALRTRI